MQSFSPDKDNWVISVSTEITDSAGENLGVLLMDMEYGVVEEHLRSLDVGREGYVFLVNDRGELVYHKDTGFFTSPEKKEQLLMLLAEGDRYDKKKNLLDLDVAHRANEGIFMSFQSPVEVPGVNNSYFLKTAINEKRKYQGLEEIDAMQFLKHVVFDLQQR